MFPQGLSIGAGGFPATRADGTAVTLYAASGGWHTIAYESTYYGLLNVWGNGGMCGGSNACAGRICPAFYSSYTCHFDQSNPKFLFGR